ncbi:hypothetical protein FB107DRAFT_278783 [Schizophyllum commune]
MDSRQPRQPLTKDEINLEFARMSGLLYDLNPRNFEDRWYALVGTQLSMLCRKIKCNAVATAQDSIWAGNTYTKHVRLADVDIDHTQDPFSEGEDKRPDNETTPSEAQKRVPVENPKEQWNDYLDTNPEEDEDDGVRIGSTELDQHGMPTAYRREPGPIGSQADQGRDSPASPIQQDTAPSASQDMNDKVQDRSNASDVQQGGPSLQALPTEQAQPVQQPVSGLTVTGGNRHRVPDSAINGFVSIDFTPEAMQEATRKRQEWTTSKRHSASNTAQAISGALQSNKGNETSDQIRNDTMQNGQTAPETISGQRHPPQAGQRTTKAIQHALKKLPPIDPENYDALRNPYPLYRGRRVVEFKIINAESKRLPSRHEVAGAPPWDGALVDLMDLAQCGNIDQIRVFFASPHWNHQDSVMLLATAGDFQTHTIATRNPDSKKPAFRIQPWSMPVWYGSEASKRREDKVVKWINTTFSPEAMMNIALKLRDEAANRPQPARQQTPPEEGNVVGGNGPPEHSGPSVPSDPPAAPTAGKRKRNRNKVKSTEPTRSSRRKQEGNTHEEPVSESEHKEAPPSPRIPDAEQVSGNDGGRLAQDNARERDAAAHPGPSASLGPGPPTHPTGKTRLMRHPPGGNDPGTSKPKDKGKGKARADPIVESEKDSDDGGPPLSPVLEADEGSDSDEDRPARKKARAELSSEGPPSTGPPSPIGNDVQTAPLASTQPAPLASTQPVASTSTNPAASSSTQPAPSTSTQPAASTSTRRSLERRESTPRASFWAP